MYQTEAQNNLVPVRLWIRGHYTRLTGNNKAKCIHCNRKFMIYIRKLATLHKHLVETHPDKLTEEEKKEIKFHWIWDYYIAKSGKKTMCKRCKAIITYYGITYLKKHLQRIHKISGPTSDNVTDNESSADDDMDANNDVTIRAAKRQEASCNSTNLSNSLNKCTEGRSIRGFNEEAKNNLVPVLVWIRRHYTKSTRKNKVKCIHCNRKFIIYMNKLAALHKHLVETHPDKLTEEEKKEVKFYDLDLELFYSWTWGYFTFKDCKMAICKICKATLRIKNVATLKGHLKSIHKDAADNFIPVLCWIREHYTKLTRNNEVTCDHCKVTFFIHISHLIILHEHLVAVHPDKLTEEQKKETKFHWIWDHYITRSNEQATCKRCKAIIMSCSISNKLTNLIYHLKNIHKISCPTSDYVLDNVSSSDDDMDTNNDITIRTAKRQKASCNSTNLSNNLNECTEGAIGFNEEAKNNLVPVRFWIRGHYTRLTRNNKAKCIHCNGKFMIYMNKLATLHKHLVETHPDKLTEEEKKEVNIYWTWDYFTVKDCTMVICNMCKATIKSKKSVHPLKVHLKSIHKISGPTPDHVIDNENSSDDEIDTNNDVTIRTAKRQKGSCNSTNLSNSLDGCTEGTKGLNEGAQNNLVPVRLWIRGHYTRLTGNNKAKCIHCNRKFMINIRKLATLHKHLVETHPDKLTEEEKKEIKFHWIWDYYIAKSGKKTMCKRCKAIITCYGITHLKKHLRRIHKISGPTSDNVIDNESSSDDDMDANNDVTIRAAKASCNSTNLSNSLNECTEGRSIRGFNEEAQNNLVPVRLWIRGHYTRLTENNKTKCIHCNGKFMIYTRKLYTLHKHLVETHPDKLTEEEKKEVNIYWTWDYFTLKDCTIPICNMCKTTIWNKNVAHLKGHLKSIHKISGPTPDHIIDNENSSNDDMDTNNDVTVRTAKRQKGSCNATNLSNSLDGCTEGTKGHNEEAQNNLIPVLLWIRGHYTKLTMNKARCIHCNEQFIIRMNKLAALHKHLIETHPDKLTEEEKKEVNVYWTWDYFTLKDCIMPICNMCKTTIRNKNVAHLKDHLRRIHKISGPTPDHVIDNENSSDDDIDTNNDVTIRTAKRQKGSCNSTNLSNSLDGCTEGTKGLNEEAQNDLVPVLVWIRRHYTKSTWNNKAKCIHCNRKFIIYMNKLAALHKHLVETHPDKLTEEEKKEVKFYDLDLGLFYSWTWDYFTLKDCTMAICKICKATLRIKNVATLKGHLKSIHKISGPTLDNVIDNENSSDDDMDTNNDVTIRTAKRQKVSCNSTNLSNNLNECTEGAKGFNEEAQNNLVPVRLWIRGHYTRLTGNNKAKCIHCNRKFMIYIRKLATLHKHLVEIHPDKLTKEEKKEIKFHWIWDYYIVKSGKKTMCKRCKAIITYYGITYLKKHLQRIHKISGPTSDNVTDNESSSDDDMGANNNVTIRAAKRQKASCNSTNLSNSLNECTEGRRIRGFNEEAQNNLVPVRLWIRGHYTRLTGNNKAKCIHCNGKFMIYIRKLYTLHNHLVETHPDKLTEEEKKEVNIYWTWDYFTVKDCTMAICNMCKVTINGKRLSQLKVHLKNVHKISGPTPDHVIDNGNGSDDDMDTNNDVTIRTAKHQKGSCNSTNLSNSLDGCTEGTKGLNEEAQNNLIPVLVWIRRHYTKSTRNNKAKCIHCNRKFIIYMNKLAALHKHLVETHPDKLTEEEKKEVKFYDLDLGLFYSWIWDYFTLKDCTMAICKICKATLTIKNIANLKGHLKSIHKILGSTSDNVIENNTDDDMGTNKDIAPRKAKRQEALSNSNLSDNLYECAEGTEAINE